MQREEGRPHIRTSLLHPVWDRFQVVRKFWIQTWSSRFSICQSRKIGHISLSCFVFCFCLDLCFLNWDLWHMGSPCDSYPRCICIQVWDGPPIKGKLYFLLQFRLEESSVKYSYKNWTSVSQSYFPLLLGSMSIGHSEFHFEAFFLEHFII